MSSQPNRLTDPSLKQQNQAPKRRALRPNEPDLEIAPRTLRDIDADFRGAAGTFAAIPYDFIADRFRLASGATFCGLTDYIAHLSGRWRKPNENLSFEAEISIPEVAMLLRCNERSIDRELLYLAERQMAVVSRLAGRKAYVKLMVRPQDIGSVNYPGWANIPQSYAEWAAEKRQHIDERAAESEQETDNPAGTVRLKKTRVKPGHQSEPQDIDAHVRTLRVKCPKDSPLDIQLSGKVVSGELVLSVTGIQQEAEKALQSKQDAKVKESSTSVSPSRHARLENAEKQAPIPANVGGSSKVDRTRQKGDARAQELIRNMQEFDRTGKYPAPTDARSQQIIRGMKAMDKARGRK